MRWVVALLALLVAASPVATSPARADTDHAAEVDPFIGTGGHGHTFPGAVTPFGMVQLSPDTRIDGSWDGCSGYHYSDSFIYGFSHTHLSGTGCSDWGDVMLMPYMGDTPKWQPAEYGSKFSHKREQASPGYYQVTLDDDAIDVELTVTPRVGFHRYTFKRAGRANVILDLNHRDKLLDGEITILSESPTRITGYRRSEAWAKDQLVCFAIEFSKPMTGATFRKPDWATAGPQGMHGDVACNFTFDVTKGEELLVKVALSPVRPENARANLEAELPHWDFDIIRKGARDLWNRELSKIEIDGGRKDQRRIFYTALYHCMIHPSLAMDVDGSYLGRDLKPHRAGGFTYYTVFSLWDTFRALHPLLAIIDRARTLDFIKTFLAQYEQGGRLPVWELSSNETDTMIGYHAIPVIVDAIGKGIVPSDMYEPLFEAMLASADRDVPDLRAYVENGAISVEDGGESVSKTLEYAYDDWCIALVAGRLHRKADFRRFMKRSYQWMNVFDPTSGFMRPRQNGGWYRPFDPREVNNHYTEANAWQYTFFVPQDVGWLVAAMGGEQAFESKLDDLFAEESHTTGRTQADITGTIGQYAHGNEPSHHVAYLYDVVEQPGKTRTRAYEILTKLYGTGPGGLCGNDDCGQLSAWFVFSALGFYPVAPASERYAMGTPLFETATMHLENGGKFTRDDARRETEHMDAGLKARWSFLRTPVVRDNRRTFRDSLVVDFEPVDIDWRLFGPDESRSIHFTTDGSTPTPDSPRFEAPFAITESAVVRAIAVSSSGEASHVTTARYHKFPNDWAIDIHGTYNRQYTAGGDDGIIDGLRGDLEWRKGGWQGYQGQDFEAVIDLRRERDVTHLAAGFLQDTRSWILMPKRVVFSVSTDGRTFHDVLSVDNAVPPDNYSAQIHDLAGDIAPVHARFVRVRAENFGTLPSWHAGAGDEAFIFVDEIMIR